MYKISQKKWKLSKNSNFKEYYLIIQPIDEKFLYNTHMSKNVLFILISESQTQIYKISQINENFPKIAVFKKIILKYNILMKNSYRIIICPQIFLLS